MARLLPVYRLLASQLGPSRWWPAESPLEVMLGAILTQNTSWKNVEKALAALRESTDLEPERIRAMPPAHLAECIRSSGYFNQKAERLRLFLDWFAAYGFDMRRLRRRPPEALRQELLGLKGIGPETADSILCYAVEWPFFVVDAYTFRLMERLGLGLPDRYEPLREAVESEFRRAHPHDTERTDHLNEFHALIVRHGNTICRKRNPDCPACPLRRRCRAFSLFQRGID